MTWTGHSTRKQTDAKMDKIAKIAQKWLQKGFTPEQVADGIWNKVGYTTSAKNNKVQFYGFYNDEKSSAMRIRCEISKDDIVKFD